MHGAKINDSITIEENFELFLPFERVMVLQSLVGQRVSIVFNFASFNVLFEDKFEFLE